MSQSLHRLEDRSVSEKSTHSHDLSRRQALKRLAGIAGVVSLATVRLQASSLDQRKRSIPSSGEQIPVMGLGSARTFDTGSREVERAPLREVMRLFVAHGGKMIDSSPMYGRAERVIGDLASELGVGNKLFYATKIWTAGRDKGIAQMAASFRLLRTPLIDLIQVHNLVDTHTHLASIREWIKRWRIRYIGITHYTSTAFDELERLVRSEKLDFVQFPYSIVNRHAEERLIPVAAHHGVGVIAHRNFENGTLFQKVKGKALPDWAAECGCKSWGNFFLKYLIADPRVTNVIPATTKPRHLVDNMHAGLGPLPDESIRRRMIKLVEDL